jgi:hypothetical protein
LVVPPNDREIRHDVRVAAAGHALKSVTTDKTATIGQSGVCDDLLQSLPGVDRTRRQLVEDTF